MNWNNTQFDGAEPVTLRASRQFNAGFGKTEEVPYRGWRAQAEGMMAGFERGLICSQVSVDAGGVLTE
jgi:hypothetical protein